MLLLRVFLVFFVVGVGVASAKAPKRVLRAQETAEKAAAAWEERDAELAVKLAMKAIKLDKENVLAHHTLGSIAIVLSGMNPDPQQAEAMRQVAAASMAEVARLAPDSFEGALAADYLEGLVGADVVKDPVYTCSPEAEAAYSAAEGAWMRKSWVEARVAYDQALALCPDNAVWWLHSGDALFSQEDYAGARARYEKAEALYPCYWSALRFRADAWISEGEVLNGFTDATRAVACNPTYDTGWRYLDNLWDHVGADVMWERTQWISRRAAEKGTGVARVWAAYWVVRETPSGDGDALARERRAVARALEVWTALPPDQRGSAMIWPALADAQAGGKLDAAIYLWLLDADLLPSFEAWRVEHHEEMVGYITEFLVVKRGE